MSWFASADTLRWGSRHSVTLPTLWNHAPASIDVVSVYRDGQSHTPHYPVPAPIMVRACSFRFGWTHGGADYLDLATLERF
jgi:hypothetical protein